MDPSGGGGIILPTPAYPAPLPPLRTISFYLPSSILSVPHAFTHETCPISSSATLQFSGCPPDTHDVLITSPDFTHSGRLRVLRFTKSRFPFLGFSPPPH